ncbi:HAMP domain-containing sensor histidine kinase [Yeosuana marina]|uniref:sensor histidine kinase n=1 Tax=Yeosuana marina TaxID=1565536 RepID=UPI0030C8A536
MKKRKLYITIFITTICALFIVQYQYLKIGLNLAKVQFNKNIGIVSQDIKQDLATKNQLSFLIGSALIKDESHFDLSIASIQDASQYFLNDFIHYRLSANGINTDFTYRLFTRDSSFYLKSPNVFKTNKQLVTYPIELVGYLPTLVKQNVILELQFKDLNSYFLWQLNGLTIPSLLCIIVIIFIFIWVLKSVYWQHKVITTTNAFINNLTHELKTPVFSIGLATKILEDGIDPKKQQFLNIIRQQVERLNTHIDKVLELGKLEFKRNIFNLKTVDFKPSLIKICEDFEALSELQNIQFTYSVNEETLLIKADINHLENAISNILDNAQKYSESPIIHLKTRLIKKQLAIIISDNGIGINKKEKNLIFKKYYRVSNGNLHKVKGYGLGLSYVKEVINKHKGKVKIDSNLGQGTTVTIVIPLVYDGQKK